MIAKVSAICLYPPDWEYEAIEDHIKDIGELWKAVYAPVEEKYREITSSSGNDELEEFSNGFLTSLRKVMVRLEKQGALQKLSGGKPVWTLVTEIDADTEEEEQLLEEERKAYQGEN